MVKRSKEIDIPTMRHCRARLYNSKEVEIKIAMEELKKIMQLRVVEYVSDDCSALPSTQSK